MESAFAATVVPGVAGIADGVAPPGGAGVNATTWRTLPVRGSERTVTMSPACTSASVAVRPSTAMLVELSTENTRPLARTMFWPATLVTVPLAPENTSAIESTRPCTSSVAISVSPGLTWASVPSPATAPWVSRNWTLVVGGTVMVYDMPLTSMSTDGTSASGETLVTVPSSVLLERTGGGVGPLAGPL